MDRIPLLWSASVKKDGAAFIRFVDDQLQPKPAPNRPGVTQLDMTREDMAALRDLCDYALTHDNGKVSPEEVSRT